MLKNLLFSIPVSLFCVLANAQTVTTASSTPANTLAKPATTTAAAPAAATSATEVKKEEAPKLSFRFSMGAGYETQLKKQEDGSRSEELSYSFLPGASYGDYSLTMFNLYIQDLKDTGSTGSFIDPLYIFGRKGWVLNDYFKLTPGATLVLPMTEGSKNNTGLLYSIEGALTLGLQTKTLGWDDLSVSYMIAYNRYNTQFSTNAKGDPLTAYRLRNRLNIGYSITDKLSLGTRFQIDSKYSAVASGVVRNDFYHHQSLAYAINDNVEVSMQHTNTGSVFKAETYENNIKFIGDDSSTMSIGLDVSL
jgi:hypothetical protein